MLVDGRNHGTRKEWECRNEVRQALGSKVSRERIGTELEGMFNGVAPTAAVRLLHQLRLLPQVFTPPSQLLKLLGPDFGAPGVQLMAAAEELIEAVHLVLSQEDRRLVLLAALLLPLRDLTYSVKGNKLQPATSYIIRESLKWRVKEVDGVVALHSHATQLVAVLRDINATGTRLSQEDSERVKITFGRCIRQLKAHWKLSVLMVPLLQLPAAAALGVEATKTPAETSSSQAARTDVAASQEGSFGRLEQQQVEAVQTMLAAAAGWGLEDCWQWKPLLDGKQTADGSFLFCWIAVGHICFLYGVVGTGASQDQLSYSYSRRSALVQVPGVAFLATICAFPTATVISLAAPLPVLAAGNPRQLSTAEQAAVYKALGKVVTKPKAPVLLRLAYHDAGSFDGTARNGGSNASVQFELDRPENTGLKRGWRLIEQISDLLKDTEAGGKVSQADLIALAGAYAVEICGGPAFNVPVGRVDAVEADPEGRLISERAGVQALKANFADKGLNTQEMVVLSGAHTLGGKGFGDPVTFDNAYYTALIAKPWLNKNDPMADMIGLPSDHVLPDDAECLEYIQAYAADQQLFFRDFAAAYEKLTKLGAVWA
eukprot:gene2881-3172_t